MANRPINRPPNKPRPVLRPTSPNVAPNAARNVAPHAAPNKPQSRPVQARTAPDGRKYVNDGQFLNQGHYENVAQIQAGEANVHAQMDQDLNPPLNVNQNPNLNVAKPHQQFADTNYAEGNGFYNIEERQAQDPQRKPQPQIQPQPQSQAQLQAQLQAQAQHIHHSHLRPEFVQGNEYQQPPETPITQPHIKQDIAEDVPVTGVGSIATFGNQVSATSTAPKKLSPIIPRDTIIGKSILFIIIAMCFLASLSIVSLLLVQSSVDGWTADIGKQATVQIIPSPERDVEADIATALKIIRATGGIAQAEPLTKNETAKLLEPWIGDGVIGKDLNGTDISILDELPIPSLIALEFLPDETVNLNLLDIALKAAIPGISVDDHKKWLSHLSSIGNILKISAFAVLLLVVSISISIIVFATDAAMNSNKGSIEILFLVGAEESFITREVRYHFLWLGFKAGVIGALVCVGFILLVGLTINIIYATQFDNLAAARILFGQITLSPYQYLYLLLVPLFSTLIAGITVHLAAKRIIDGMH